MITGNYAKIQDNEVLTRALACARGVYQRNVILGVESLSGATLRGTAKSYGYWYAQSRRNLLCRLTQAGVAWHVEVGAHGKRVLVIGS